MTTGRTEPTTEQQNAYERGKRVGQVDASLDQHELRLDKSDVIHVRTDSEMNGLKLGVQRLDDRAASDAATRLATAQALKEEREATAAALEATTNRSNQKWTPAARLTAFLGSIAAVVGAVVYIYLASKTGTGRP